MERHFTKTIWNRGIKIADSMGVLIESYDSDEIVAEVFGNHEYNVTIGATPDGDFCECPYFEDFHSCKHLAAAIIQFEEEYWSLEKQFGEDYDGDVDEVQVAKPRREVMTPDNQFSFRFKDNSAPSSGTQLVKNLGLTASSQFHGLQDVVSTGLTLETTLFMSYLYQDSWGSEERFFIKLKYAVAGTGKFYVIKDLHNFLRAYQDGDPYVAGPDRTIYPTPASFTAEENELLERLTRMQAVGQDELADRNSRYRQYRLVNAGEVQALIPLLNSQEEFTFDADYATFPDIELIPFAPELGLVIADVLQEGDGYRIALSWRFLTLSVLDDLLIVDNQFYAASHEVCLNIKRLKDEIAFSRARSGYELTFKADEFAQMRQMLAFLSKLGKVNAPDGMMPEPVTAQFDLQKDGDTVSLALDYEPAVGREKPLVVDEETADQAAAYLQELGFKKDGQRFTKKLRNAEERYDFYRTELPNLRENGTVKTDTGIDDLVQAETSMPAQVSVNENDGFLAVKFAFDGIADADVDKILAQLDVARPYIERPDGSLVLVDEELTKVAKALKAIRRDGRIKNGALAITAAKSLSVQAALGDTAQFNERFQAIVHDLTQPEAYALPDISPVQAELRHYQIDGVKWLTMLASHGFGGILADEMGLGKTLQVLAFLNAHRNAGKPHVVVAPASLIYNWEAESVKFTPDLHVVVVDGNKAARRELIATPDADILITSYNGLQRDAEEYEVRGISYLILDEAQAVKNASSKTHQQLRTLNPKSTFALSGTPIENRTEELLALFNLVLPGLLPSKREFKQLTPAEIALRVKPFIIRREKQNVLQDLPDKIESNLLSEMTAAQKTVYLAQLKQMQVQVKGLSKAEFVKNKLAILAGLTRLRQICDTPALFMDDYRGTSGKLEQLAELIESAADNGRHVLIFSQFTGMLDVIEAELGRQKQASFRIDGSTKKADRLAMVNAFNDGEKSFFLISLKAGGTGLNLTGADMVILVDLWWNPAVEDQAVARAHRIGQQNEVDVYRLITKGTIEEQIVKLQEQKRDLVNEVLAGTENKRSLTEEEIKLILGI